MKPTIALLTLLLLAVIVVPAAHAYYTPQTGDYFQYAETQTLNNGTGIWAGYTETTNTNGQENMVSVSGNIVSANYSYTYIWNNNQNQDTTGTEKGSFTYSSSTFNYVSGTDDEQGYTNPYIWFYINNQAPVGSTVFLLNTGSKVLSNNYTYDGLQTIYTQGNGTYVGSPDNNAYGTLQASYTWDAYFDTSTGFIVGYHYIEQDSNSSGSFSWTDNLTVVKASYLGSAYTISSSLSQPITTIAQTLPTPNNADTTIFLVVIALILVIGIGYIIIVLRRRRKSSLPEHSSWPASSRNPPPTFSPIQRQQPQQIIIKEEARVQCQWCGTMVPTTVKTCSNCGGSPT